MADLSDVETALVALVATAIYPNGADAPPANGMLSRVYRGWPEAAALDCDLAAGYVNVTVFPEASGRNTTRYLDEWLLLPSPGPLLTATLAANTVTFAGNAAPGQLAGILADSATYVHATAPGDTPALVAADLAALLRQDRIVLLSGTTIVIPGVTRLLARVVAEQPAIMQTRRQEQSFRITCWCPDPASRDISASVIDTVLAQTKFISLSDGSVGRLRYRSGSASDQAEDASLYRRDLVYQVEYPTTVVDQLPTMLFADILLGSAQQVTTTLVG
ncbi:MAG: hypothetical protein JO047_04825 [Alphaproteobacteria bacterium]|nr:hypothetical protein [Alphaproteobacteria bacterium]